MRIRCEIGKVIVLLYENYKKALSQDFVYKPISYALYHTWKYVDSIEKPRELKEQNVVVAKYAITENSRDMSKYKETIRALTERDYMIVDAISSIKKSDVIKKEDVIEILQNLKEQRNE